MIRFFADPHLGVNRAANTTQASAKALQGALFSQARRAAGEDMHPVICLGDMFDNFSNPEKIHGQGMEVLSLTDITLSGNHDVVNQSDKVGTLQLLDQHYFHLKSQQKALFAEFGKPACFVKIFAEEKVNLLCIPHVASQDIFEESLEQAIKMSPGRYPGGTSVLCLHCNYDLPAQWLNETTLNLTREKAQSLLDSFDYILLGHEHVPSEHFDGRLVVLGNTHPTSLADVSDKRIAFLEDGKLRFETIWSKDEGYAELDANNLPDKVDVNFARVKGSVESGAMLDTMKKVSALWRKSPDLYVMKMDLDVAGAPVTKGEAVDGLAQLPGIIRKELEETPELLELWDRLVKNL